MVAAKEKGKQRANNPFDTPSITMTTAPTESSTSERSGQHISMASDASNERAIQSLIAVLDAHHTVPLPTDARSIRPPSTQASFTSVYASAEDGEEPEGEYECVIRYWEKLLRRYGHHPYLLVRYAQRLMILSGVGHALSLFEEVCPTRSQAPCSWAQMR